MTAPIVTVRGEATVTVPPDLAGFSVTLHATGTGAEAVRSRLAEGSAQVARLVAVFDAALESSSTSALRVAPVFFRQTPSPSSYSGTFTTHLVLHDFDALSPLVLAVAELPGSQVDGPGWSLRTDHPAYRDARLAAVADARGRAEDYAVAFGATLDELLEISDLEPTYSRGMPRRYATAMAEDETPIDFTPEAQTVSGEVTVRFTLRGVTLPAPPPTDRGAGHVNPR